VLSGGEQQMLALCRTLMGNPALAMIDEPPRGWRRWWWSSGALSRDDSCARIPILLVEQKLAIALDISERVYVLGHGRVVFEGTPAIARGDRGAQAVARSLMGSQGEGVEKASGTARYETRGEIALVTLDNPR